MTYRRQALALGLMATVAACATAPEYRWIKAGVDAKGYEQDRVACLQTVERDFNPYYDYGPLVSGQSASGRALFRSEAAEKMFRDCMRQRGYRLVTIEPAKKP
jgi:hypothetical protein